MSFYDFFQRMTGQQPPMSGQPQAPFSTMPQIQSDDYRDAAMSKMGQLGMLLVAAGQRMTPKERATILAQAPQYMDGVQRDAMTAEQARLMNMQGQAAQNAMARQEELKARAPELAKQLGFDEKAASYLTPEQLQEIYVKKATQDPRDAQLKDAQIQHYLNAGKSSPTPQMVDLQGGGKGWATPGSPDVLPIGGAGKGGVDPEMAKRTEAEDKNLTFAKEAIVANNILADPKYSGQLTSGYNQKLNMIPTVNGSWAGENYLVGDRSANSFVDSVVRPRSGAVVGKEELENNRKIYTPAPGDSQEELFRKAKMRSQHIQSLIAGANPADRPMLQKMFEDSQQELLKAYNGTQNNSQQSTGLPPGVKSVRPLPPSQ